MPDMLLFIMSTIMLGPVPLCLSLASTRQHLYTASQPLIASHLRNHARHVLLHHVNHHVGVRGHGLVHGPRLRLHVEDTGVLRPRYEHVHMQAQSTPGGALSHAQNAAQASCQTAVGAAQVGVRLLMFA